MFPLRSHTNYCTLDINFLFSVPLAPISGLLNTRLSLKCFTNSLSSNLWIIRTALKLEANMHLCQIKTVLDVRVKHTSHSFTPVFIQYQQINLFSSNIFIYHFPLIYLYIYFFFFFLLLPNLKVWVIGPHFMMH
jgi:hypothetical protein